MASWLNDATRQLRNMFNSEPREQREARLASEALTARVDELLKAIDEWLEERKFRDAELAAEQLRTNLGGTKDPAAALAKNRERYVAAADEERTQFKDRFLERCQDIRKALLTQLDHADEAPHVAESFEDPVNRIGIQNVREALAQDAARLRAASPD